MGRGAVTEDSPSEAAARPGDGSHVQRAFLPLPAGFALAMTTIPAWGALVSGGELDLIQAVIWAAFSGAVLSMMARQYLFGVDRNGVFLQIDQRGVYFGGLGMRYAWCQIAQAVFFSHPRDDGVYRCGHVVLVLKDDLLSKSRVLSPFRWGPSQTMMLMSDRRIDEEKARIRLLVRRHAVAVEVLDLGKLDHIVWCRKVLKASWRFDPRHAPTGKNGHWWSRRGSR
jgi:hypothetical protein